MTAGTPPALSARLITIVETSSCSVEPLGTSYFDLKNGVE
jgi:hypothetical protein